MHTIRVITGFYATVESSVILGITIQRKKIVFIIIFKKFGTFCNIPYLNGKFTISSNVTNILGQNCNGVPVSGTNNKGF